MKTIKLDDDEIKKIQNIITQYKDIFSEIKEIENRLIFLNEHKNSLINNLNELRLNENKISNEIVKKYGKGQLKLNTFEYEQN